MLLFSSDVLHLEEDFVSEVSYTLIRQVIRICGKQKHLTQSCARFSVDWYTSHAAMFGSGVR